MSLADRYDAVVCDLDGVVYRGAAAVPHAVQGLRGFSGGVQYATNNASRPPSSVAVQLRDLGLDVADDDVATSAQAGAWVLTQRLAAHDAVLAIGGAGVARAVQAAGFRVRTSNERDGVAGVLQGYGAEVTAADLGEAAYAIQAGALWVATNTDATLPTDRGVAPGNGALVDAVRHAVGRAPDLVAGKPHPPLYRMCLERLGTDRRRSLAVGDRLETDIEGAVTTGMDSVLVLTGVHTARDAVLADPARRPTYVLPDLRWLHRPFAGPVQDVNAEIERLRDELGSAAVTEEELEARINDIDGALNALCDR